MIITHSILEILDIRSGIKSLSQKELDLSEEIGVTYAIKTLEKIIKSPNRHKCVLNEASPFLEAFNKYKNTEISFIDLANIVAEKLYSVLYSCDDHTSVDLLISEFRDEDKTYFGVVLLKNKEAITHAVSNADNILHNEIIKNFSILPTTLTDFFYISLDGSCYITEHDRLISNEKHKILTEYLMASPLMSNNEEYRILKNVTAKVCEEHDLNPAVVMAKVKTFLADTPVIENMKPEEIADQVFDSQVAKEEFNAKMHVRGITNNLSLDRPFVLKKTESHKIKTDTGIEINFPSELFTDSEHLEFINEADGTISIRLKNINKIINK